jgi:3-deoxy-7-phosphoheptulonate synthase
MLESNLNSWNQSFTPWKDNPKELSCWVSITDACIDLDETKKILEMMNKATKKRNS